MVVKRAQDIVSWRRNLQQPNAILPSYHQLVTTCLQQPWFIRIASQARGVNRPLLRHSLLTALLQPCTVIAFLRSSQIFQASPDHHHQSGADKNNSSRVMSSPFPTNINSSSRQVRCKENDGFGERNGSWMFNLFTECKEYDFQWHLLWQSPS